MVKYINKKNPNYKRGTSYPEQFIYRCLVQVFDALNRIKDSETGLEFDIEIRELNLRIEYSGEYWHQNSIKNDNLKRKLCYHKGIEYIEIIELASKHETIIKEEGGYTLIIVGVESNFLRRNTKLIDIVDYIMKKYGYSLEDVDIERAIYEALACTKQYKYDIIKSADNLVLGTVNKEFRYDTAKVSMRKGTVETKPVNTKDYSDFDAEDYKEFILDDEIERKNLENKKIKRKSLKINKEIPFALNQFGEEIKIKKRPEYKEMSMSEFKKHCKRIAASLT